MAAVHCDNFVGNAWKKDLCLNCFKSKEEHLMRNGHQKPTRIPDPPKEGILKKTKTSNHTPKGNKVIFLNKEFEIIGFGGDDVYSDEDDFTELSNNSQVEEDNELDSEEDRAFQKLTKSNTDYNSVLENLQEPKEGEVKKIIEPLKLGKQVFDEKGNKKTLLVSVTPFEDQTTVKSKTNVNGFKINSIFDKEVKTKDSEGSFTSDLSRKEVVPEKIKPAEEKTEIVNGDIVKKNIRCLNGEAVKKNEECESHIDFAQNGEDFSVKQLNDKSLKRSQPLDKNSKVRLNKDLLKENEKNTEMNERNENDTKNEKNNSDRLNNILDVAKKKVNQFPVISENQNFKFKTKNFTSSSPKNSAESDKSVLLDIYKIKEKEDIKANEDSVLNSSDSQNKVLAGDLKVTSPTLEVLRNKNEKLLNGNALEKEKPSMKTEPDTEIKPENGLSIDRSKLVPNISSLYRHHFKNTIIKKKPEENLSGCNGPTLLSDVLTSTSSKILEEKKNIENKDEEDCGASKPEVGDKKESSDSDASTDEAFKKSSFESFENFEKIIKGEEITLFSVENGYSSKDSEKAVLGNNDRVPEISRESAGEPDGRADSDDVVEPPALPLKPPPPLIAADTRPTFFHDSTAGADGLKMASEKPKVPAKPIIIQSKKINFQSPIHSSKLKSPSMEKFLDVTLSPQTKQHPLLQESLSSDSSKNQKRPAPKPPSPKEDPCDRYVALAAEPQAPEASPKTSDLEEAIVKRISRSTENLLEFITCQEEKDQLKAEGLEEISVPEPVPRRSLSFSQDSLVPDKIGDSPCKKKSNWGRFFLRKLLHLGIPKETIKDLPTRQKSLLPPTSKPKLEIIHPSDLNGSRVEVVPPARTSKSRRTSSSASSSSGEQKESDVLSDSSTSHSVSSSGNDSQSTIDRTKKPPPPPRAHSLDPWGTKPARPPPPKSLDVLRQVNFSCSTSVEAKTDNLYVNLGEARSGLAPNKPIRTGSLRESNMQTTKKLVAVVNQPENSDYESFVVASTQYSAPSHQSDDNLYECVQVPHRSSLPECDSTLTDSPNSSYAKGKFCSNSRNNSHRHSEGNIDISSDYFKIKCMRSASLPYCASETESELYSPYSFYGSEIGEEDYESSTSSHALHMSRLKLKKGRSIVHKNLEENYGAVIVAIHEALTQVVEQMRQSPVAPPALRALTAAVNLRWSDFTVAKDAVGVVVERRVFYPAFWGNHAVTLSLMAEQGLNSNFHAKGPFSLNPLTELNDLIPSSYLPMLKDDSSELIQASISVLTRLQIETLESYGKTMNTGFFNDESKKEINFVLLQIINALKTLQAQGIEEAPKNLTNLIVCREEKDPHPRICITHSFDRSVEDTLKSSLCQCVTHAIENVLPPTDLTQLILSVLQKEKAVSLSQAKGILEFTLWGPADIAFGNSSRERESALQRWLDLERATVLHGLVRTRAELTVFEEWQLLFLVRTNAKMMAEASFMLETGFNEEVSTA